MLEGRDWFRIDGATPEDLAVLLAIAPKDLPARFLDLLAFSNGGEGPLSIPPYNFCLDSAITITEMVKSKNYGQADLHGFLIFGGNGGGQYLAFDTRHGGPWPIVAIDMVVGGDSAELIASDFDAFYERVGIEPEAT